MNDWFATLDGLLERAWRELARGAEDGDAAARLPVLATVGADGGARARTLALRRADRAAGGVDLYTDAATSKIAELRANPGGAASLAARHRAADQAAGPRDDPDRRRGRGRLGRGARLSRAATTAWCPHRARRSPRRAASTASPTGPGSPSCAWPSTASTLSTWASRITGGRDMSAPTALPGNGWPPEMRAKPHIVPVR